MTYMILLRHGSRQREKNDTIFPLFPHRSEQKQKSGVGFLSDFFFFSQNLYFFLSFFLSFGLMLLQYYCISTVWISQVAVVGSFMFVYRVAQYQRYVPMVCSQCSQYAGDSQLQRFPFSVCITPPRPQYFEYRQTPSTVFKQRPKNTQKRRKNKLSP